MFWVNVVIFYCIAWSHHFHLFKPFDCSQHFKLNFCRKSIIQTIRIDNMSMEALRL